LAVSFEHQTNGEKLMNKNTLFFWLNIVLGILLFITVISLAPNEGRHFAAAQIQGWILLHEICGTLMLAISAIHLVLHWDWVKAVVLRRTLHSAKTVRRNRTTDLWLFAIAVPCAVTGIIVWALPRILPAPLGLALIEWRDLHNWTGTAMFVILGIHLTLHWKWIASQFRRRTKEQAISPLRNSARSG
jgi:hypothetical protein